MLPELPHLGRGLDVVAVAVELEPLGVAHHAARRDAEQVLVRVGVGLVDVVGVVGRDRRDAEVLRQAQQAVADPRLDGQAVVHQLEEEVLLAEDVLEVGGRLPGLVVVADPEPGLHLARRAAGGADEARGVLRQELAVGPGLVVLPLEGGARREPEQVVQPLGGLGQQRHVGVGAAAGHVVVAAVVPPHPLALVPRGVGGAVGLQPDDRLDPLGRGPWCRTRRPRTRCRGRSSRSRPCRARRSGRTGRPAGRRRRAWSTRCARGGGRSRRRTWVWHFSQRVEHGLVGRVQQPPRRWSSGLLGEGPSAYASGRGHGDRPRRQSDRRARGRR